MPSFTMERTLLINRVHGGGRVGILGERGERLGGYIQLRRDHESHNRMNSQNTDAKGNSVDGPGSARGWVEAL